MSHPSVIHHTFVIERTYPAPPERVLDAFADPAKKRRWFYEGGAFDLQAFSMDFKVGGQDHAQLLFKEGSPLPGRTIINNSIYQDIVPGLRIIMAYAMSLDGVRFSASQSTLELVATDNGTRLILTHQGAYLEGADGPQMREQGYNSILDKLGKFLGQ